MGSGNFESRPALTPDSAMPLLPPDLANCSDDQGGPGQSLDKNPPTPLRQASKGDCLTPIRRGSCKGTVKISSPISIRSPAVIPSGE
jgi:hypothetical protein